MNKRLLARIEKLEQAIQDILASCSCLTKDLKPDLPDIPWEPEEPEWEFSEDDIIYCPEPVCPECGQEECICDGRDVEEEPEEEEVDHE